jgi:hypothetical protein
MPKKRDDSNPLDAKRRSLEHQEKLLAQKRAELKAQLESHGEPETAAAAKAEEPPVWRMEDEEPLDYETEPARYRHLARQRRRDMIVFFACITVLLIVIAVLLWVVWGHTATATSAANA